MYKKSKLLLIISLSILVFIFSVSTSYGNSAEPPSVFIIVPNAPDDLEVSIRSDNAYIEARRVDRNIESYFTFYSHDLRTANDYILSIRTGDSAFEITLDESIKSYNDIFTLDLKKQILKPGKSLSRSISLVSLRIILTLIVEAVIFWLFGYRYKKSWIAFIIINLTTQGIVNIWLNGFAPMGSYLILGLIFAEILILMLEFIAFLISVKEHNCFRTILYVLLANFFSLIIGGYIITVLPV